MDLICRKKSWKFREVCIEPFLKGFSVTLWLTLYCSKTYLHKQQTEKRSEKHLLITCLRSLSSIYWCKAKNFFLKRYLSSILDKNREDFIFRQNAHQQRIFLCFLQIHLLPWAYSCSLKQWIIHTHGGWRIWSSSKEWKCAEVAKYSCIITSKNPYL